MKKTAAVAGVCLLALGSIGASILLSTNSLGDETRPPVSAQKSDLLQEEVLDEEIDGLTKETQSIGPATTGAESQSEPEASIETQELDFEDEWGEDELSEEEFGF